MPELTCIASFIFDMLQLFTAFASLGSRWSWGMSWHTNCCMEACLLLCPIKQVGRCGWGQKWGGGVGGGGQSMVLRNELAYKLLYGGLSATVPDKTGREVCVGERGVDGSEELLTECVVLGCLLQYQRKQAQKEVMIETSVEIVHLDMINWFHMVDCNTILNLHFMLEWPWLEWYQMAIAGPLWWFSSQYCLVSFYFWDCKLQNKEYFINLEPYHLGKFS